MLIGKPCKLRSQEGLVKKRFSVASGVRMRQRGKPLSRTEKP